MLSRREFECLKWAAQGKSAWEINQITGVSRRTAAFRLDNARAKVGVGTVKQAIAHFAAENLICPSTLPAPTRAMKIEQAVRHNIIDLDRVGATSPAGLLSWQLTYRSRAEIILSEGSSQLPSTAHRLRIYKRNAGRNIAGVGRIE